MAKKTPPNKPKPQACEVPDCGKPPTCVLGGFWFCAEHGNRDYEKPNPHKPQLHVMRCKKCGKDSSLQVLKMLRLNKPACLHCHSTDVEEV
jgi:hypothetical protein